MDSRTHLKASPQLVGTVVELEPGRAVVELHTTPEMAVDEHGLVHGAFAFGAADYAAMLAINEPTVVLGSATSRFLKPVVAGETIRAEARVTASHGRKHHVSATVLRNAEPVLECELTCFVPPKHVLEPAK